MHTPACPSSKKRHSTWCNQHLLPDAHGHGTAVREKVLSHSGTVRLCCFAFAFAASNNKTTDLLPTCFDPPHHGNTTQKHKASKKQEATQQQPSRLLHPGVTAATMSTYADESPNGALRQWRSPSPQHLLLAVLDGEAYS